MNPVEFAFLIGCGVFLFLTTWASAEIIYYKRRTLHPSKLRIVAGILVNMISIVTTNLLFLNLFPNHGKNEELAQILAPTILLGLPLASINLVVSRAKDQTWDRLIRVLNR